MIGFSPQISPQTAPTVHSGISKWRLKTLIWINERLDLLANKEGHTEFWEKPKMARVQLSQIEDCSSPCSVQCNCSTKPTCAGPIEKEMQMHFEMQLDLCGKLEKIADDLPHQVDKQQLLQVARTIFPTIKNAHHFEENRIFPQIQLESLSTDALETSLERLQYEHWEDESFAEELCDAMIKFVRDDQEQAAETLSYMLRGFFEGIRRHIAFESEHILPLLQRQQASAV